MEVAGAKVDTAFAHRTKVLHLEAGSHHLVAALVGERLPRTYVRSAADCSTRRLALSLGEDAMRYCCLPTFVSGNLLRVNNAVFQGRRFLHRDKIRCRLGEIIRRRLPATAVDGLKGPMALGYMRR